MIIKKFIKRWNIKLFQKKLSIYSIYFFNKLIKNRKITTYKNIIYIHIYKYIPSIYQLNSKKKKKFFKIKTKNETFLNKG